MDRIVILNTSILTTHGRFAYERVDTFEAIRLVQSAPVLLSAVGHQSTADIVSRILGVLVPMNRIEYRQTAGDVALVFKLRGRPPEGVILTTAEIEAIGFDFGTIQML